MRWQEFAFPRRSWARRQFGYPANEVIQSYCNAIRLSRNPHFAYQTGLRFHVSTYGMYGFAILSSTSPNHGVCRPISPARCAARQFSEQDKVAVWTMSPFPFPQVDAPLYKFIVELQAGVRASPHRDIMGQSFGASELHFRFGLGAPRTTSRSLAARGSTDSPKTDFYSTSIG